MKPATASFLRPLVFACGRRAPNRVALAPMTTSQSAEDGSIGGDEVAWLARRARGGHGIIITCASHVLRHAKTWPRQLGIYDDRLVPGLRELATAIHAHGSVAIVQLHHGGFRCFAELNEGQRPISASAFDLDVPRFERPRAASESEIEEVIAAFGDAARRAIAAGFDGVEIHAANGYLLTQFLSAQSNRRSDRWGGGHAGRVRLLQEVVLGVRRAVGSAAIVGVRISLERARWLDLDLDESLATARWLGERAVDYVHLSMDAAYDGPWDRSPFDPARRATPVLALFRRAVPGAVPLMVAGGIWRGRDAAAALDAGADLVALGRASILNPDWPRDAAMPDHDPRRPPLSRAELRALAVGEGFDYILERMKYIA